MAERGIDIGDTPRPEMSDISDTFSWNEGFDQLRDFEDDSSLPRVVRLEEDSSRGKLPQGLRPYTTQPVLLYARTCKRHARARTIYHDVNGPFFEVGQTIVIPDDFQGWFELVPPDFGKGNLCQKIAEIADINPKKFFTRTNLRGIRIVEEEGGQTFKERKIKAGSVLRVDGTFAAKWRTTAETGMFKSKKSQEWTTIEMKYLKCIDIDEEELLVPVTTPGRFSVVYEKGISDSRAVFRMKDLISDFQFPLKVRMVYGKAPVVPCIFTGMLVLKESKKEDVFICSTTMNKRNVLFELPISAPCHVRTASKEEEEFSDLDTYKDARQLCHKYALPYASLIKLSPELDTNQQMIQHIPTEKRKTRDESLKTLDLITNISLTDDEPRDRFMDSDTDSIQSAERSPLPTGELIEMTDLRASKAFTNC